MLFLKFKNKKGAHAIVKRVIKKDTGAEFSAKITRSEDPEIIKTVI